jgi:hypothetical protein
MAIPEPATDRPQERDSRCEEKGTQKCRCSAMAVANLRNLIHGGRRRSGPQCRPMRNTARRLQAGHNWRRPWLAGTAAHDTCLQRLADAARVAGALKDAMDFHASPHSADRKCVVPLDLSRRSSLASVSSPFLGVPLKFSSRRPATRCPAGNRTIASDQVPSSRSSPRTGSDG